MPVDSGPRGHSFYNLSIEQVFKAAEFCGMEPTGEYFQLNSYENRVFDLFLEPKGQEKPEHIIAKIYRPGRWSREAIEDEHSFLKELQKAEIPAVAPIEYEFGSVLEQDGLYFSFFPKASGRMPQELSHEDLQQVGRQLARLHNVGVQKQASHRPHISVDDFGWDSLDILEDWVAPEVWGRYEAAASGILEFLEDNMEDFPVHRIHGDCHKGNILQTDPKQGPKELFFVDFDDFINGLAVQDFWMLFSGDETENHDELQSFLSGYEEFRQFDRDQLILMPAFRGLRIIYYGAWIVRRWADPSFPKLFPEFRNFTYWAEEVEALEKIAWQLES